MGRPWKKVTRKAPTKLDSLTKLNPANLEEGYQRQRRRLNSVTTVASINIVLNILRPDPEVPWQMRLPRICWEFCIWIVAQASKDAPSIFLLLLSLMTGSTALVDIFLWGPLFASFASFEKCRGGFPGKPRICKLDYTRGVGRIVASLQSTFGGLFYLTTAVIAWQEYREIQQERKIQQQVAAMSRL